MTYNWLAVNEAIRSERAKLKWSRDKLASEAGVSLGTIKNLEGDRDYKRIPVEPLRAIDDAFGWPQGTLEAKLRSEDVAVNLESRYRRETATEAGRPVAIVEDALYRVFMVGNPDTSLAEFDRARRRVFEVLQEAGIDIAERHDGASSGSDDEP